MEFQDSYHIPVTSPSTMYCISVPFQQLKVFWHKTQHSFCCSTEFSNRLALPAFYLHLILPYAQDSTAHSKMGLCISSINQENAPTGTPTDHFSTGNSSSEVPSFKMTLIYVANWPTHIIAHAHHRIGNLVLSVAWR